MLFQLRWISSKTFLRMRTNKHFPTIKMLGVLDIHKFIKNLKNLKNFPHSNLSFKEYLQKQKIVKERTTTHILDEN